MLVSLGAKATGFLGARELVAVVAGWRALVGGGRGGGWWRETGAFAGAGDLQVLFKIVFNAENAETAEGRREKRVIVYDSVDVQKARDWILADFYTCSCWGRLTQLLTPRIAAAPRSVAAFVGKWVDVASLASYEIGAPPEVCSADTYGDELAAFVQAYLESSDRALLLCQVGNSRKTLEIWDWSVPPRYFEDAEEEGYYALKAEDRRDFLRVEATLSDALGHFGAAICTKVSADRLTRELDGSILEEAAANAEYLIVPAFDGDGYLVWEF